jgi:hypothetical protein
MKVIALISRTMRDLKESSLAQLTAESRLEILDAVNGSLQELHDLAPPHSKIRDHAFYAHGPMTITLNVTQGSTTVGGDAIPADRRHCTIRLYGDAVDNQVRGSTELFHPYAGPTGTVSATVYSDALAVPELIDEVIDDHLWLLETRERVTKDSSRRGETFITGRIPGRAKRIARPQNWWMESDARNANPESPALIRLDTLPDSSYRMQARVSLAPGRISFVDMLTDVASVPMRPQHVESYLLPLVRARMTTSSMWRDPEIKKSVEDKASEAKAAYANLIPQTISTQANRVGTPFGF